jgi:zinc transport system substrate-binding protein
MFTPSTPACQPAAPVTPLGRSWALLVVAATFLLGVVGVSWAQSDPSKATPTVPATMADRPLSVVVSIPPLEGIVRGLLPEGSTITTLIPPGVSEHGFEFPASRLAEAVRADLVVYVGWGLEGPLERFLAEHPRRGRVELSFADVIRDVRAAHAHHHAPAEAATAGRDQPPPDPHHHDDCGICSTRSGTDPHVWLDPLLVRDFSTALTRAIGSALARGGGSREQLDAFAEECPRLRRQILRLNTLHERYEALRTAERRTIVVAHDAWSYLATRYGLTVVPIAGLNANEPTPAALRDAVRAVREHRLTHVFGEPQLSGGAVRRVAEAAGVRVAMLDPLGSGDWFAMMERNLVVLGEALGASIPPAGADGTTSSPPSP